MKRRFLLIILFIFIPFVTACNESTVSIIKKNVSDLRVNYFEGRGTYFSVAMSCGYREENFNYDGISTSSVECGVITICFFETHNYYSITAIVSIDGQDEEIVFLRSPYEDVYMADVCRLLTKENIISVHLKNQTEVVDLIEISSGWEVDWNRAISIGVNHYKNEISGLIQNKKISAEAYLKIIAKDEFDKKYWYFSIIDTKNNTFFCLIDVNTGDVVSNI